MSGDLHCHTSLSDGSLDIKSALDFAKRVGLEYIAITNHDTLDQLDFAQEYGKKIGIKVIMGVELSTRNPENGRKVHLLCYLPQKTKELEQMMATTCKNRNRAGEEMVRRIAMDYPITMDDVKKHSRHSKSIYKTHIMRAFMDYGYAHVVYGRFFQHIFKENKEKYAVAVDYPSIYDAIEVVHQAGGVAVLAHPCAYKSMELLETLAREHKIDGVELHHPRNTPESQEIIKKIAQKYQLIVTGGTDFHGFHISEESYPIGTYLTNNENIDKILKTAQDEDNQH